MKKIFFTLFLLPSVAFCQEGGVQFQSEDWQAVLSKAKAENKYIFVDTYASWCGPCKKMDRETYPNDTVGRFVNQKFVAVKLQMDTSAHDDGRVKDRYADAHFIMSHYRISEFPTYLFFNPDGKLVYRDLGYQTATQFIQTCQNAMAPENVGFYQELANYKNGKKVSVPLYELANYAQRLKDNKLAKQIAEDYVNTTPREELLSSAKILFIRTVAKNKSLADSLFLVYDKNYLDKMSDSQLCTKENTNLLMYFFSSIASTDRLFQVAYSDPEKFDQYFRGISKAVVEYTVTREEMSDKLLKDGKAGSDHPDWSNITATIEAKYPKLNAELLVTGYKIDYYKQLKDWDTYTALIISRTEKFGHFDPGSGGSFGADFDLNNLAWQIFLHSSDPARLEKALMWSDSAVKLCTTASKPNWMDTKANILYKLGRKDEAIRVETRAAEMDPKSKSFQEALEKMKQGQPTW